MRCDDEIYVCDVRFFFLSFIFIAYCAVGSRSVNCIFTLRAAAAKQTNRTFKVHRFVYLLFLTFIITVCVYGTWHEPEQSEVCMEAYGLVPTCADFQNAFMLKKKRKILKRSCKDVNICMNI